MLLTTSIAVVPAQHRRPLRHWWPQKVLAESPGLLSSIGEAVSSPRGSIRPLWAQPVVEPGSVGGYGSQS
jgi:hypothetical protein